MSYYVYSVYRHDSLNVIDVFLNFISFFRGSCTINGTVFPTFLFEIFGTQYRKKANQYVLELSLKLKALVTYFRSQSPIL